MSVELHITGRIERGRFAEFSEALAEWVCYREARGWALPRVLHALSGEMNTVLMVFAYPDLGTMERQAAAEASDVAYARIAMAMPFEGPIDETIFRFMPGTAAPHAEMRPAGIGCAPGA